MFPEPMADAMAPNGVQTGVEQDNFQPGAGGRVAFQGRGDVSADRGEETGRLSEMLIQVADVFDREVQTAVKRTLGLLEPALILGLGLIIGAIIMSILVAILSVNELAV